MKTFSKDSVIKATIQKLKQSFSNPASVVQGKRDYALTFAKLGLPKPQSQHLAHFIFEELKTADEDTLRPKEDVIVAEMERFRIQGKTMSEVLREGITARSRLIHTQIRPYFDGMTGPVIDFGCGNGVVAQMLHESTGLDVSGYDVVSYPSSQVTVPIELFDGKTIPVEYEHFSTAVVTNVLHHDEHPSRVLQELTRITSHRLVIIETVPDPVADSELDAEMGRVFFNDYLYNRLINAGAGIGVPGMYDTPQGWIASLEALGWKVVASIDLGIDQKVILDRHHLLVFDK